MNFKNTPIFILAKDRKSCLEQLITRLERDGHRNLFIVDTGSTFPPMVEYLGAIGYPILRHTPKSHHAPKYVFWDFNIPKQANQQNKDFIYTDCDVVPDEDCPGNWLEYLHVLLKRHKEFNKAGLGLKLKDIPDHYAHKEKVLEHEAQFYIDALSPHVFKSQIDTTLALYRAGTPHQFVSIRTGGKYLAKHLPWYYDTSNLPEEEKHYLRNLHPIASFWTKRDRKHYEILNATGG